MIGGIRSPTSTGPVSPADAPVTAAAWAKVNLWLHVVGRRDDGYHLLDSLVVFAGVGDTIVVSPAPLGAPHGIAFDIDGPFAAHLPTDSSNLVVQAAERLAEEVGAAARPVTIRLTKRLPPASGIGGGSADAAATLQALLDLWRAKPKADALAALALSLGADVPVCLAGRPAFVGGIGECIEPTPPLPPAWLVLANPGVEVPTAEVFRRRHGAFSRPARLAAAPRDTADLATVLTARANDLTAAALTLAPVIGDVLAGLARLDGALLTRMSGSGATCFALFSSAAAARAGARRLQAERPDWWVADAPMLRA